MTTEKPPRMSRDTVKRSRAAIAASMVSIDRSAERIRDTLHILMRSRSRFDLESAGFTDEQLTEAAERWRANAEQREIEQEVLRTTTLTEEN